MILDVFSSLSCSTVCRPHEMKKVLLLIYLQGNSSNQKYSVHLNTERFNSYVLLSIQLESYPKGFVLNWDSFPRDSKSEQKISEWKNRWKEQLHFDNMYFQSHAPFASDNTSVYISQFKFFVLSAEKKLLLFIRKKP